MVEYSNLFVVMMGMGVVFFGLICIIALTTVMGKMLHSGEDRGKYETTVKGMVSVSEPEPAIGPEVFAVITSVLSEEAETTPYGLNIVDIRKL